MTREEAVKILREAHDNALFSVRTALETLTPELHESEDERIRKALINFLQSPFIKENLTDEMVAPWLVWLEKQKKSGIQWLKSDNVKNPDKPYVDKAGMFYTTDGRMCYASEIEKQKEQKPVEWEWPNLSNCIKNCKKCHGKCFYRKEPYEEQKPVECIEFDNEFDNQVSHLLASVLNGEHKYNKDFVKYASQSLLGYAKNELKSDELNEREKLMKALQTTNAQIGELVEENYKLKEQKPVEIDEYKIIKKHITEDFLSSEVNKRLKECGWYVTDEKPAEWDEDYNEENIQTRFAFYTYKDDPCTLYLSNVFVEETSRNKGFGTKILTAAEKVAETFGVTYIRLKVKQGSPANAWYRKNSYGYVAFEDGYDWLEKNLEYMKPNKQEWSKEDEEHLKSIISTIEMCMKDCEDANAVLGYYDSDISWLKSLRHSEK